MTNHRIVPKSAKTLTGLLLIVAAAAVAQPPSGRSGGSGPGAAAARPVMQLTALDYFEIEQLTRKYAWALDTCSNDGFDYADLYTPDGTFVSGSDGQRWQGREQLAEAAGGNGLGCPFPKMPLSHLILNLVIEPTADGAIGKSYLIYPGRNGQYADEQHHGHDGGYQDAYVKTADGWRFKSRIHVYPPQIPGQYTGVPNSELEAAGDGD
jgi:SnoaL-like domain